MRGSGQKTARESAPPRASGGRRRLEPTALVPTEVNGDGVEVNGDRVAVNEEQAQFGRLVAFRRQRLGMSQEELAAQMGIGLDGVVRIEQGEAPGPEMSGRLDRALRDEPQSGLARWSLPVGGLSLGAARSRLRWNGLPRVRTRLSRPPGTPARGRHRHRRRAAVAARRAGRALWERRRDLELGFTIGRPLSLGRLLGDAGAAARAEARQERLAAERQAAKRAAAAAAERRREAKAAAAARREQEESEVASTPESPAPVFVPAPSGGGGGSGGGSSAPAPNPDAGHALTPEG